MARRANFQSLGWFYDLYIRKLLDLDPPYQRRSVWNQDYKDYFVDTVLNGYPSPAIFLYEEVKPDGVIKYSVVDGKQRLTTLFEFIDNRFPVYEKATIARFRGKYFKDFDDEDKKHFWMYQFSVEYLPTTDERIINNIFDRINRNVAKLTPQELRHARFDGEFITVAEELSERLGSMLPLNFPLITTKSKKQMKDVELVAQLLLLIEEGPKSYSQDDLDQAFSDRDTFWEMKDEVVRRFEEIIKILKQLVDEAGQLTRTRFRNQTDFYSLFGAINELLGIDFDISETAKRLLRFISIVEDEDKRERLREAQEYYDAARSASNDAGPRRKRINIIKSVITGDISCEV